MINILFCGNYKVFDGILINLLSMRKHTKKELGIYLLTMDLSDQNEKFKPISKSQALYLDLLVKESNSNSFVKIIDITDLFLAEMANAVNLVTSYTPYCLLRLFADQIAELPTKIIYLDTDTVINADIQELFDIDVTDYEFAGVIDYLGKVFIYPTYLNSGVLLLNLAKIRETNLFSKARKMILTKRMWFPDQSALNKLVSHKLIIPRKFNSQRRLYKDTVIQHFCKSIRFIPFYHTINVKPWQVDEVHKRLKITHYDDILNDYLDRIKNIEI